MKRKSLYLIALVLTIAVSSCTTISQSMREPNTRLELKKEDFIVSKQVTGEATEVKILGIDFERLFKKSSASVDHDGAAAGMAAFSIPIIGNMMNPNKVQGYALYQLMSANSGYDVVFYPQFASNRFNFLGLYQKTNVKVTARLGKFSATKKDAN